MSASTSSASAGPPREPLPVSRVTIGVLAVILTAGALLGAWVWMAPYVSNDTTRRLLVAALLVPVLGVSVGVVVGLARVGNWLPFGPAPTLIILVTLISGGWLLAVNVGVSEPEPDLTLWTFPPMHYDAYLASKGQFEDKHDVTVSLSQISDNVLSRKLLAAARSGLSLPNLVEIENTKAGSFFRGPKEQIPFHDVEPLLRGEKDEQGRSLYDRMVRNRFALYTHRGTIYGIPHDVHPVLLAYRRDIFEARREEILAKTGIAVPDGIETWDDFVKVGQVLANAKEGRYVIAMSDTDVASFEPLLYQKGGDFFNAEGELIMDSAVTAEVIEWLIPLVGATDERRIAYHRQWGPQFYEGVQRGLILSFICPDWRCGNTEHNLEEMGGKLALMKLPAWETGGRRTSTWGGTMLALTKQPQLPEAEAEAKLDLAWRYTKHIYFDQEQLKQQMVKTKILPPFKDVWTPDVLDRRDPYWSNQPVLRLFAEVADDIPPRNGSPFLELAKSKMGEVLAACSNYYKEHGDEGFREFIEQTLKDKADYVRAMMARNPF